MSVSPRTIGRRTIAAVAAFSMITTGTVLAAPAALAAPSGTGSTESTPTPNTVTLKDQDRNIVPGSLVTLKLSGFADRTKFEGEQNRRLVVKIDGGDVSVPEDTTGTSFSKIMTRSDQIFGVITEEKNLPGENGEAELKIRLPRTIAEGDHLFNILGGGDAPVSVTVDFTVTAASTTVTPFPKGRLTAKRANTDIEGVAQGTTVDLHASRLTPGLKVIYAGVIDDSVKIEDNPVEGDFIVNDSGEVTVANILVADNAPLDAPFGIIVENTYTGEKFSVVNRRYGVTVNEQDLNKDMIKVEKAVRTAPGLYQSAYSASKNTLFVTRADFNGGLSELMAYDPSDLALKEAYEPAKQVKDKETGELVTNRNDRVFGIAVDEKNEHVWTTRTLGASVTVFDFDGNVVKHFDDNNHGLSHPFGIAIDGDTVYVSDVTSRSEATEGKDTIKLYDAKTLEEKDTISIPSMPKGALHMLINDGKLYTVDFAGKMVAVVNLKNHDDITEIELNNPDAPGDRGAGLALDTKRNRLWVATQSPSWVKVVDLNDNNKVSDPIRTGASPVDVLYDAENDVIWSMNRVGASVNIIDPDTMKIKATRKLEEDDAQTAYLNQLSTDGKGNVFVTSKPSRDRDLQEDVLFKLSYNKPASANDDGKNSSTVPGSSTTNGQDNKDGKDTENGAQPSSSPKISINSSNPDNKSNDQDSSSKGGGIFAIIAVIAAILGGLGFVVSQGMIPGMALPAIPGLPSPK
ncbi:YncE family protein [Corynebacterium mendelii]|uniref:YncE family protein n=1 Tax=Corynebacterium mendelii TaxID=2765362 RepID=A0A939IY42_9CORY|nr:hypothetical protein [Corynebacterium mendelii]MBN9645140.1 hypothetical protein [Corynebacterium mendelii]